MTSRVGIAIALLGAALLVTSSIGVSSVALERPVEIEVVGDESAMVGFETNGSHGNDSTGESLTVHNQAGTILSVEAKPRSDGESLETRDALGPGETMTISAPEECEGDIELVVRLVGAGISIERTERLDCGG